MGSFFKQLYRYTHPRAYRHNENLWPHMKITRAETGEINTLKYRDEAIPLADLSALRGKFSGSVMLAATGPSINEIDFSQHPSLPAMGVNGAWSLDKSLEFSFYVIVDMGFFDSRPEIISQIINDTELTLFTTAHGIARIIDNFGLENTHCSLALIEDAAFKIYQPSLKPMELKSHYMNTSDTYFYPQRDDIGFTLDIRHGVFDTGTVVYWALQIIAFLGYTQIFIIGLDMNNFDKPRFYEVDNNKLPTNLEGMIEGTIFPALDHASRVLKEKEIEVINLSVNSSIPTKIFQKAGYNDTFIKKN